MKKWPRIKIRSGAIKKRCLKKKLKIMSACLKKERSWKKFFWGSVQSDGERRKEKYLAGAVFNKLKYEKLEVMQPGIKLKLELVVGE